VSISKIGAISAGASNALSVSSFVPTTSWITSGSLLPDVNLAQGDVVLCELRFVVSGGPGVLSLSPGTVPFGVALESAQQTVNVDGEFL